MVYFPGWGRSDWDNLSAVNPKTGRVRPWDQLRRPYGPTGNFRPPSQPKGGTPLGQAISGLLPPISTPTKEPGSPTSGGVPRTYSGGTGIPRFYRPVIPPLNQTGQMPVVPPGGAPKPGGPGWDAWIDYLNQFLPPNVYYPGGPWFNEGTGGYIWEGLEPGSPIPIPGPVGSPADLIHTAKPRSVSWQGSSNTFVLPVLPPIQEASVQPRRITTEDIRRLGEQRKEEEEARWARQNPIAAILFDLIRRSQTRVR